MCLRMYACARVCARVCACVSTCAAHTINLDPSVCLHMSARAFTVLASINARLRIQKYAYLVTKCTILDALLAA
jgi:hypothetical protein